MPYTDELVRVTMTWLPAPGVLWTGEEAVTTFHLRHHHITGNGFTWSDQVTHLAQQLRDKWVAHWTGTELAQTIAGGARISEFKVAHLDPAGHTLEEGVFTVASGDLVGEASLSMMPPEVAICVSSWSYPPGGFATHKGRKRGRFYLPYIATQTAGSDGKITPTHQNALAAIIQTLFNDIQGMHTFNEDTPPDPNPDFWDFVTASKVDASWANVDFVSVDNHFDSQRRRQHQSPPVRVALPISH